ncbi:uncharacterized protein PAE49_005664 [Odontesthes bonariensis]|uniref:uncharacterized protein LOC142380488 n=1 Tax=Odontesthes bonariensis TaxID=219752 RepID=UPI003F58A8A4
MRPGAPFLLFLLAALIAESSTTGNKTGLEFIVVFPENIASYHPVGPQNKVWITALFNGTTVTLEPSGTQGQGMQAGQTLSFNATTEVKKFKNPNGDFSLSDQTLHITSNKRVVVQAFSSRSKSMQTTLVIPTDKLSMKYFIPPEPTVSEAAGTASVSATDINERSPFSLLIVNINEENSVTVGDGAERKEVSLQPKQVAQIWLQKTKALRVVEAEKPVAVLFGHPCAVRRSCSCGLLYVMLQPASAQKLQFPIPPGLTADAEDKTLLLLSETGSGRVEALNPGSAVAETSGAAYLYRPGLLLALIPRTGFASCYVLARVSELVSQAVIVVHKDSKDGIHIGREPLNGADWRDLKGTEYVSAVLMLRSNTTVIWHASSKMGVYFLGKKNGSLFGNPASIISPTPDFRGCALIPEVVKVHEDAGSWQKSIKTCEQQGLELVSFPNKSLHQQVCDQLQADDGTAAEVWIGMRRSSYTGEWYWLDDAPVQHTGWGQGEPGELEDGQCVVMSLRRNKGCEWRDEDCCKAVRPLCYKRPDLLRV